MASEKGKDKVLDYFCCFNSYAKKTAKLSDQEVGRLFRALMRYNETGERQELAGRESIAFDFIADDIDKSQQKYRDKCAQNRANANANTDNPPQPDGSERNPPQPDGSERNPSQPNGSERDQYKYKYKNNTDSNTDSDDERQSSPTRPPSADVSDAAFDRFWEAYPKKQGKGAARKAFKVAKKKISLEVMLSAVERQRQSFQWNQNGGQYIPSPARWLSEERWNDEMRVNYGGYQQQPPPPNPVVPGASAHSSKPLRELMEERKAREAQNHDGL